VNTNTASCAFTVTVVDQQKPVAVCQDITVNLPATGTISVNVTAASIDGGSYDNCTTTLTRTPAVTTYTCANLGDNNITLVVTDAAGNTDYCVATVTVRDVTAPVTHLPGEHHCNSQRQLRRQLHTFGSGCNRQLCSIFLVCISERCFAVTRQYDIRIYSK
jgi:hypothetical protein